MACDSPGDKQNAVDIPEDAYAAVLEHLQATGTFHTDVSDSDIYVSRVHPDGPSACWAAGGTGMLRDRMCLNRWNRYSKDGATLTGNDRAFGDVD